MNDHKNVQSDSLIRKMERIIAGTDRSVLKARWQLLYSVGILMIVPALIYVDIIPYGWRIYMLLALGSVFSILSYVRGYTLSELGFRKDNIRKAFLMQIPFLVGFLAVLSFANRFGFVEREFLSKELFLIFYVFISSPFQEFVYRSYMYALLRRCGWENRLVFVLFMAIPYVFVHIIYHNVLTLFFTLIAGVFWSYTYIRQTNLFAISFSHAVLGCVALVLGVV
ncbi:CPBP family intramembrane metalloprotease [Chlorobaculum sp. 24CR]|uniref:CPBP family intramembrane glutamic endopeptidase n=1 Tax=Chlorobaculum sp. 24CR TaxID=2508878 RepID=UPI00100AA9E0|nr:CPBP family intramembrane glutamic endopeptidase [Chlorobaculum sp. 24CR]RXK87917.1 CPBP family intramembrane metalloprotease [Chlorobaculum sp. 24CR]